MLTKKANCDLVDMVKIDTSTDSSLNSSLIKLASHNKNDSIHTGINEIIKAEISKHPTALFFKAKAIVADEMNSNGDFFPTEELKKSYGTFVGVPFFTNHNNQDVENARGKIVWAEWNDPDKAVYVVGFVDREAYPHICRGIEEDYMRGVSMGCSVEYSECSICKNKAATPEEYCSHIKYKKGRKFTGQAKDVKTGEIKTFKDASVHEINYGVKFIELSGVADPACKSCKIKNVIDNGHFLQKAASASNNIFMYRESSIFKKAGQEEVDQLNQALKSLEDISIKLIQNRQQVDVEFASDLVQILSELQEFTDELVGAGYAQSQGGAGQPPPIPGTELPEQTPQPVPGQAPEVAPAVQPVALEGASPELGINPVVTGAPGKPMVNRPNMPTAPAKPASNIMDRIVKISEKIAQINQSISIESEGENKDMRRIPKTVEAEQHKVMQALEKTLKGNNHVSEYNSKDSISNNNGGRKMSQVVASRIEAPEVVTEKQLEDQTKGYHLRENDPREGVTQCQLSAKRTEEEKNVTTQKQLDDVRKDDEKTVITQKQLDSLRTNEEKQTVTQDQLNDYRTGKTPEVVMEKQLDNKPGDFWLRSAFARSIVKTAKEHIVDVLRVLAGTAIQTSATPEQMHLAVKDLTNSIKAKSSLLDDITKKLSSSEKESIDSSSRVKYWGQKGVKLASISKDELKDAVVAKLNTLVAKDEKVNPETVASVLEVVAESNKGVEKIASAIDSMLASKTTENNVVNAKDEIKNLFEDNVKTASSEESKMKRDAERKEIAKSVSASKEVKMDQYKIETSLEEMGLEKDAVKNDPKTAKKLIVGFTKGACVSHNLKLAGITNVKIDEQGRVEIAISTEEGDKQSVDVELPPEGDNAVPSEIPPEGDITGEGLDTLTTPPTGDTSTPGSVPPPPAPGANTPLPPPVANDKHSIKTAQTPGAQGGAPGGIGAPAAAVPGAAPDPAMAPVQSLTEEPIADEEEGLGEADKPGQFPAGSKCPFCGSDDVDVGGKGKEDGTCECKDCGAQYSMSVHIEVLNPKEMSFEEEGKKIPEPEEPELPEMPVAASMKLTKDTMLKLAGLEKTKGMVCPACGQTDCKVEKKASGFTSSICPACETKFVREASVNVDKPDDAIMMVKWTIDPRKVMANDCESCKVAAKKFAAKVKVSKMMRKATANSSKFPMANCIERIARRWGANAVSTFGPCKGKALAECVCKELQRFGFTEIRKMNKLAEAMTQKDPMDQCLEDQVNKGYKKAQAEMICTSLKKKYATKADDNIYAYAWGDEPGLGEEDLDEMKNQANDMDFESAKPTQVADEGFIGDPLPELPEEKTNEEESITIELPKNIAEDIADQVEEAGANVDVEVEAGEPPMEGATEVEVSIPDDVDGACESCKDEPCTCDKQTVAKGKNKMDKKAEKPQKIDNVEKEVKGLPKGDAKMGNESAENIDVKVSDPKVKGDKSTKTDLPDIPSGNAYMGKEKETQKGMPENSNKIKGTVIAEKNDTIKKEAKSPEKVKNMEDKVEIPKGNATMGEESSQNIDVALSTPQIPRGEAKMGEESSENIDKPVKNVDVPTGDAYIGKEKEIQKDMPNNTVESLGTVRANDEKRTKQLERLAAARHEKACMVAAKLLGEGRIASSEMEDVVKDLSKLEMDRIESFANRVYPKMTKVANTEYLNQPIVIESKGIEQPTQPASLKDKLQAMLLGSKILRTSEEK